MHKAYTYRRQIVVESLQAVFGDRFQYNLPSCGVNILVKSKAEENDILLTQQAQSAFGIVALSARSLGGKCDKGLLLGFTNIRSKKHAYAQANCLYQCLEKVTVAK